MHIRKYGRQYGRREFLRRTIEGTVGAGLLCPLWDAIASNGDVSLAYPDELLSIDEYTKGAISTGDVIDSSNVEHVKELLEPIRFEQIRSDGRKLQVVKTTTDPMRLSPWEYVEATLKNAGQARFSHDGNIVTASGEPWIGGNPFPNPRNGVELCAAQVLSWGRHDASFYAVDITMVDHEGSENFFYKGGWAELQAVSRIVLEPKPYWPKHKDKLRFQSVFFVEPDQFAGTSFLNIWDYDQNKFPDLYGYVPEFRRVRRFPTDQRFEPLLPGTTLFLSDAWGMGDPLNTWGEFKIIHRGPFLAGLSENWASNDNNWKHGTHGGKKGTSYWDTKVELVPEAIVVETKPTGYTRAPISKKHLWFDARNQALIGMVTYDRNGKPYRSFDGTYSLYEDGDKRVMDGQHPYWSWTHVTASDIQSGGVTRLEQVKQVHDVHVSSANDSSIYERYLTNAALQALGRL